MMSVPRPRISTYSSARWRITRISSRSSGFGIRRRRPSPNSRASSTEPSRGSTNDGRSNPRYERVEMMKRLIEVALPLKEVSEQSAREKSIRHGHISTLHIWWARRPLAACRAAAFASLIPDPDDPECPEEFRKFVMDVLGKNQFKPTNGDGSSVEDTPRNRCLEFIKYLVRGENSNNPDYIEPAGKLIAT